MVESKLAQVALPAHVPTATCWTTPARVSDTGPGSPRPPRYFLFRDERVRLDSGCRLTESGHDGAVLPNLQILDVSILTSRAPTPFPDPPAGSPSFTILSEPHDACWPIPSPPDLPHAIRLRHGQTEVGRVGESKTGLSWSCCHVYDTCLSTPDVGPQSR